MKCMNAQTKNESNANSSTPAFIIQDEILFGNDDAAAQAQDDEIFLQDYDF